MEGAQEEWRQLELKHKNKIIELQKELEYEHLRANEYEEKFKEAMMQNCSSKEEQVLLSRLEETERLLTQARRDLLEANRRACANDSASQGEQLRKIVEELKDAAVAAIMEKESEIEDLKQQLFDARSTTQLEKMAEYIEELETKVEKMATELAQETLSAQQKLQEERESFSEKLSQLFREQSQEQKARFELLEKTESLEGSIEDMQKVISNYQVRIYELEQQRNSGKLQIAHLEYRLKSELESANSTLRAALRDVEEKSSRIEALSRLSEKQQRQIDSLIEDKEQSERKLRIKNRKVNSKANQSIYESFEGFSQKANLYASFSKPEANMFVKQSFIGTPFKLSDITEIDAGENEVTLIENFSQEIDEQLGEVQGQSPPKAVETNQIATLEKEINRLNERVEELTKEIQEERRSRIEQKEKCSREESCLKIQKESLRQHVFKLENALLIEKLQNAEKLESNKEIREFEKRAYEEQIAQLKAEKNSPKKKKGFFG